jgi:YD repeat-containing protein
MIGQNMIGIPLETVKSQIIGTATKTLSKTETVYPVSLPTSETGNLILPQLVKSYDIPNNTVNTELKYDKYDTNGNILQYTEKTGTPVATVWGYGNTQPIAQIEGISYDQLVSFGLISSIVTASDNDASDPNTESVLISALDAFRNNSALKGYRITTFTYDLLKGVTSITPPSGIREVYLYDTYGRLKEVRENDKAGNILKEFKYNYKP